ncbi:unnamed protein product, partial [Ixodes persulcatus]
SPGFESGGGVAVDERLGAAAAASPGVLVRACSAGRRLSGSRRSEACGQEHAARAMQALTDMELARLEQGGPRHGSLLSLHTSLPSRTSLLGKPLKGGSHPRDAKYRKKQTFMYNFLERPRGYKAAAYHIFL